MRLRLGVALLALAPLPLLTGPGHAAAPLTRPAYLNVTVTSPGQGERPTFTVTRLDPLSPEVECSSEWLPQKSFDVRCRALGDGTVGNPLDQRPVIQGFRCENAAVRATINGPNPGEYVTGTIQCGEEIVTGASCTAVAAQPDLLAGGYSGECFRLAPNGPLPIRCFVDLTGVFVDRWTVTCYGTDP